jgi:ribonuclease Z
LIEIQNRYFLVDCGEGAQMQLMRFQANLHRINHIMILHLHERDIQEKIFEDDSLSVETIPLAHKVPCTGFLFKEKVKPRRIDKTKLPDGLRIQQIANLKKGKDVVDVNGTILYRNEELTLPPRRSRSYAYCSDTAYHESIIGLIKGVDLLYHEATFGLDEQAKAFETQHSTAAQAATLAKKAEAHKLLIGHFSARYKELTPLIEEARAIFDPVELAIEGSVFSIHD